MAETEKMSVSVPSPLAEAVRQAVEAGDYASDSEVVCEALRQWEARRQLRSCDAGTLADWWDAGKASGRAGVLDIKRLVSEERAKRAVMAPLYASRRCYFFLSNPFYSPYLQIR